MSTNDDQEQNATAKANSAAGGSCAAPAGYAPPRRKMSPMLAMLMMGSMLGNLPPPKPKRKCLLKGCDVMTDHNGGYCCSAHFAADCGHTDRTEAQPPENQKR